MRRLLYLLMAFAFVLPAAAAEPPHPGSRESSAAERQAIEKVVQDFQTALRTRNTQLLSSLMLDSNILFASPAPPDGVKKVRETVDVNFTGLPAGGFLGFARFVQASTVPVEERFYNVQITQDAHLAIVAFDFDFLEDGKIENRGMEAWQLLKTGTGWKIFSVVWTSKGAPKP